VLIDALRRADEISWVDQYRLNAVVEPSAAPHVNLIIPRLDPGVIFGGYLSYFQFARALQRLGFKVRFIVIEELTANIAKLAATCRDLFPDVARLLHSATILDYTRRKYDPVTVTPDDLFIAYSSATAKFAHNTVEHLKNGPFIFYIQEEEGHFHSSNAYRAFKESIYKLPHLPIYNSQMLVDYFRMARLGPFDPEARVTGLVCFRHALATSRLPSEEELAGRERRKLLFFARPELHAERNLFELGLLALRKATANNLFPREVWGLDAIGTAAYPPLELYGGQHLNFRPRLGIAEYGRALADYDIGLSLMYAPHPSVPNLEMAAAGVVTVTTTFVNRGAAAMAAMAPNLVPVPPSIEGIYGGLVQARERTYRFRERIENAKFEWPRHWAVSFGAQFRDQLVAALTDTFGAPRLTRLGLQASQLASGRARVGAVA
jgi:hypothetical protein